MRQVSYEDIKGRLWMVSLPDGMPDNDASMGIPIGPPSLEPLGLPEEVEVRIHNQLFHRRLFTLRDIKMRRRDVFGALQAALKVDTQSIVNLYMEEASDDGKKPQRKQVRSPEKATKSKRR